MGIFDRLKRLARSEITEMKRVLSDRDDPSDRARDAWAREESEHQRAIREAEDELARAEHDVLAAEIEMGASAWGQPTAPPAGGWSTQVPHAPHTAPASNDPDIARGASLWGAGGAGDAPASTPAAPTDTAATRPYEGRGHAFPREVRDAYAALELPLGSTRDEVERAFRDMLHRYHPDKHASDARRQAMAHDLTMRIREARDVLAGFLDRTR